MGVVALLPLAGTWNYHGLAEWAATTNLDPTLATLLCLSLIAGPLGKCAQFPLHLWLDEAMEGPLPATVLRNTLVVATGAWVLVKIQPILVLSPVALSVMIAIVATTAIGASLIAIAQIDIKRSLSYTVSAFMGLIFIAVGTGQTDTALQLILTYTLAMSILVMCVGGIIWNNVTQDLTQYGGLWSRRPISGLSYLVGIASLIAVPPFGTFWAWLKLTEFLADQNPLLVGVLLFVNTLTAFNVTREFCLIFGGKSKPMTVRSPEALWLLVVPMLITVGFALHLPLILKQWHLLPDFADINLTITGFLIASSLIGISSSSFIYLNSNITKPIQLPVKSLQDFFAYDLYTAQLYKVTIVAFVGIISTIVNWFDKFIVDGVVNLVGLETIFGGQSLKYNVTGQTQFYVLSMFSGIAFIALFLAWPFLSHAPLIFAK
jgi:NAD(P)H-quinone oxidoreductase subunit 5